MNKPSHTPTEPGFTSSLQHYRENSQPAERETSRSSVQPAHKDKTRSVQGTSTESA